MLPNERPACLDKKALNEQPVVSVWLLPNDIVDVSSEHGSDKHKCLLFMNDMMNIEITGQQSIIGRL